MTNAERQKRYRDKRRGGPPVGRWAGHTPAARICKKIRVRRTFHFMFKWICKYAPDVYDVFKRRCAPHVDLFAVADRPRVTPTYTRLKEEYDRLIQIAVEEEHAGKELVISRRAGRFVYEWVPTTGET